MTECRVTSDTDGGVDVYTVLLPRWPSITSPSHYIICPWGRWDISACPRDWPSAAPHTEMLLATLWNHCIQAKTSTSCVPSLLLPFSSPVSLTLYVGYSSFICPLAACSPWQQTLISRLTEAVQHKCGQSCIALIAFFTWFQFCSSL